MINWKPGRSFEPHLSRFSALALHQTVVLLLIINSCGGQSQMVDQPQPIVAMPCDDVILPCHLEPAEDAVSMTVEWARDDLNPRFVHLRRDGVLVNQNPSYIGRTSLSIDKLKHGDLSLKLSKVKLSDEGTYRCLIPKLKTLSFVKLTVGSISSPVIIISKNSTGLLLECKSKGWHPEPEVLWLDGEGNVLSAGPTETVRGPDGLYTVGSRLTVEKRHSNNFTCRVQQKDINQTRETQIHVLDDLFQTQSQSVYITIGLAVSLCFILILVVAFVVRIKQTKTWEQEDQVDMRERETDNTEPKLLTKGKGEETGTMHMEMGEMVTLLNKKTDGLKELHKCKDECKNVEQTLHVLNEYIEHLNNCREQLELLSSWIGEQILYNKEKQVHSWMQNKIDKYQGIITDLDKRKEANETLLQKTKEVLRRTENEVTQATEKKRNLQLHQEQIKKDLEDITNQREALLGQQENNAIKLTSIHFT